MSFLFVALGGALGAVARYAISLIPDAVHTDLYDGGDKDYIPFDKLESFFKAIMKL